MPLLTKDALKETLFDSLGWRDREWFRKLGSATIEMLHRLMAEHLRVGTPVIVEANFRGGKSCERSEAVRGARRASDSDRVYGRRRGAWQTRAGAVGERDAPSRTC